jgi:hypothetical protein
LRFGQECADRVPRLVKGEDEVRPIRTRERAV